MKQIINTQQAPTPIGIYSQAVRAGQLLYISGQIGMNPETETLVSGGFEAEARQVFENIQAIVESAGGRLMDVIKLTVYVIDMKSVDILNDIMQEIFHEPYPVRAVVQVSALPRNALVEIETTALLG